MKFDPDFTSQYSQRSCCDFIPERQFYSESIVLEPYQVFTKLSSTLWEKVDHFFDEGSAVNTSVQLRSVCTLEYLLSLNRSPAFHYQWRSRPT